MSAHPRLSLNQATVKHASLLDALDATRAAGIGAVGLWREPVADVGLEKACALVADSGLRVSSLCRGGFFTAPPGPGRTAALAENRRAIEETAALAAAGAPGSAPVLVLVAGGLPGGDRDLAGARERARDAVGALADDARAAGVVLAIEPMHPVFAADRGVVSTLGQALDVAEQFPAEAVGVVVDTYHVWWDPDLPAQVARAGRGRRIASYQLADWVTPLGPDVLVSRGLPGDGHADLAGISALVEAAGYRGDVEVEVFAHALWDADPADVAARTAAAFAASSGVRR
ncbi:Sugar phosphate isomerase/epimerase [Geodermatophilus dictyosporus]|uniref:Sugar phosphate isomerase/epimerase n=1 Tax=Geodermatophilus dictyosporus TaxID=1523247 RepID=A0A1I5JI94_9ACTN|nr:sugar phosphate isomerase/epimerase family protein [Geodermatophilus dictyosporus]SFO72534.1 Sugar phosphate isomerase/epimerase [Geodermatophilus dictyosporus]